MLNTILKYPLSYPLTEIDLLFCECISGLIAQDTSRAELVFVVLLTCEDTETVSNEIVPCKSAKIDFIKRILSANPTAINSLASAIQATIPTIHCIKKALPWMELILLLETHVDGVVYGTVEAVIKLFLLIDSHIEAFSMASMGVEAQAKVPSEMSLSQGTTVGSYISPSFGSHVKSVGHSLEKHAAFEEPQKNLEEEVVEGCPLEDTESIDFCVDVLDQLLVCYFEHIKILWTSDSSIYVKHCQNVLIPCFARLGMCLRNIRYTQFIIFYAVSFNHNLPGMFIEYLIKRSLFDADASISVYLDSMNYLGSFIARYSGLAPSIIIGSIKLLMQYAIQLGAELDPTSVQTLDRAIGVHRIAGELCLDTVQGGLSYRGKAQISITTVPCSVIRYLSVIRALLYSLCFIAEDLTPENINTRELSRLLIADLCPIVYFYDIGVQLLHLINKWAFMIPSELDKLHAILNYAQNIELPYHVISCFYPFEPMCLQRSNSFIAPHYRDYWVEDVENTED